MVGTRKKVLDMCPWSYEKQLVLLQEFNGKLTLKEVEIRWAPFWVQIFNLPLNCRTKEIGLAIGTKLGEVLEIDVQESGVQWGTCLRVKVRLDVTKRLIRGKKITVEGGESRWVNFKYERLPNFCYRCGLLNHALKECPENGAEKKNTEGEMLQYGTWMRGDFMRRYAQEQNKMGMDRGANTDMRRWGGGVEPEKRKMNLSANKISVGVGEAQDSRQPASEEIPLTQLKAHVGEGMLASVVLQENGMGDVVLHENGMGDGVTEKKEGKVMAVGVGASVHDKSQTLVTESMTKGWTEEKLGQNSRHWKRLAQEVKKELKGEEKAPKSLKREGQIPLSDLDPKALDTKCRKEGRTEGKQISRSFCEDTVMVGREVVATRQHRRAS